MGKRKEKDPPPVVEEWAEEREAAAAQLLKSMDKRPGADDPDVIVEEGRALVKLHRPTEDGRRRAAVAFATKGGKLTKAAPEDASWAAVPVTEYLAWAKAQPVKWLRDEAEARTGRQPAGTLALAVAAYLAAMYQLDVYKEAKTTDGTDEPDRLARIERQEKRVEKYRALADVRGLTESEFQTGWMTGVVPVKSNAAHTEEGSVEDTKANGGNGGEAAKPEEAKKPVVKKKAPAAEPAPAPAEKAADDKKPVVAKKAAAKEDKPVKAKKEKPAKKEKAPKEKKERKPKPVDPSKLDEYGKRKLAAQKGLPVGKQVTYHGPVKWADGKSGKVARHEPRGGVFVEIGDKTLLCSPFAFEKKEPKPAKEKKAKAAKKGKK